MAPENLGGESSLMDWEVGHDAPDTWEYARIIRTTRIVKKMMILMSPWGSPVRVQEEAPAPQWFSTSPWHNTLGSWIHEHDVAVAVSPRTAVYNWICQLIIIHSSRKRGLLHRPPQGSLSVDNCRDRAHAAYPGSLDISYLYDQKATTTITPIVIL